MNLYVVIPTYNEAENIENLLIKIAEVFKLHSILGGVIVVDDASPDGTGQIVQDLQPKLLSSNFELTLIERKGKLGLGSAYLAGFKVALAKGADTILEMDADFSHNPEYIPHIFATLKTADVVIGSRYVHGGGVRNWSIIRKLISRLGSIYSQIILRWNIADATGGFNAWHRQVLESIDLAGIQSNGYAFQIELKYRALQAGFNVAEIPIIFTDREKGKSKMSVGIVREAINQVWKMRFGIK